MSKGNLTIKIIIAITLATTPIIIYFINFSLISGYSLSKSTQQWSDFGSYLGGVYSWLAFTGILLTLHFQKSELEHVKKQAQLDELLKLANDIYEKIYSIIFSTIDVNDYTIKTLSLGEGEIAYYKRCNTFALLGAAGKATLRTSPEHNELFNLLISRAQFLTQDSCYRTVIEAERLDWCLRQYLLRGGSEVMCQYYISRLSLTLLNISLLGFNIPVEVKAFFELEKMKAQLISTIEAES